ncbi:MAG: Aminopeptidase Metallo peptidase [Lacunisphaera sp.]|nr:Aminopeptidase Metallo peptidase [Lacunisphaera sp.]
MPADFEPRLRSLAEVIVRVGLNLQRGQRLLIAEPYELQGVARSAEVMVEAVKLAAGGEAEVIWGDGACLRQFAEQADWRGFSQLVATNADLMQAAVKRGDALLFLQGNQPRLMDGIAAGRVTELRRIAWEHFGPIAQQLTAGATNWTVAPAPSPAWAHVVFADLPSEERLAALWHTVFASCRVNEPSPLAAWHTHLQALQKCRDGLNAQRLKSLRYLGPGTDLTVTLPAGHLWFTAQLQTKSGVPFVANLPTEEVFTVPHRDSATGTVRGSRPINYGGAVIDGIVLEFRGGRVIKATAKQNDALLQQLLATDEGASRLGEVAMVLHETSLARTRRLFHHPLLDENTSNHIALGEAYPFCLRAPDAAAFNRSLIHVDLPLEARVTLSKVEPA